ncbi:MAG: ArnT family glycosyltransferase [Patescibacteria group bacterium]
MTTAEIIARKIPYLKRFRKELFIVIIFLIGFVWRFWNFPNNIMWSGDAGRDLLAAYLIADDGQRPVFGHWNSGLGAVYPPIYYYFLAGLTFIIDDYRWVVGLLIFLHSLSSLLVYKITRQFFSWEISTIVCFMFASSRLAIIVAAAPITAHFAFLVFLISLFLMTNYLKHARLWSLMLASFFLVLSIAIFYGGVIFIPIYALVVAFVQRENGKKMLISLTYLLLFISSLFIIFYQASFFLNWKHFLFFNNHPSNMLSNLISNYSIVAELKRYFLYPRFFLIFFTFLWLIAIKKKNFVYAFFSFSIFILVSLAAAVFHEPLPHFSLYGMPFFYLSLAITFRIFQKKYGRLLFTMVFIVYLVISGSYFPVKSIYFVPTPNTYRKLDKWLQSNYPEHNAQIFGSDSSNWDSRSLWYFQRKRLDFSVEENSQIKQIPSNKDLEVCMHHQDSSHCQKLFRNKNFLSLENLEIDDRNFWLFEKIN